MHIKCYRRGNTLIFQEGSLTDAQYFIFLIDVDVTACNNAENYFGNVINDHVAMLFASMKPGSKLITSCPLHGLGRDLDVKMNLERSWVNVLCFDGEVVEVNPLFLLLILFPLLKFQSIFINDDL